MLLPRPYVYCPLVYSHAPYFPIAILLPMTFRFKSNQLLPTSEAHSLSLRVEQFTSGTMALKFDTMMKMSMKDLRALALDLDMHYPTTFVVSKFQLCMDIPAHIFKFKEDLEEAKINLSIAHLRMIADELEINEEGDKQTLVNDIANALEDVSADIWYREQQIVY